jgi:hypothetical protein
MEIFEKKKPKPEPRIRLLLWWKSQNYTLTAADGLRKFEMDTSSLK